MLQFHGTIAELEKEIQREKSRPSPNPHLLNYYYALHKYKMAIFKGYTKDYIQQLGEAATRACVEFNKNL